MAYIEMDFASGGGSQKCATGLFTASDTTTIVIDTGFKPNKVFMYRYSSTAASKCTVLYYDFDSNTILQTTETGFENTAGSGWTGKVNPINNGFEVTALPSANVVQWRYVAIKD